MKLHHSPRGGRILPLLGTMCLGTAGMAFAQQEDIPYGKLSVDNTLVRVGAQSQLQWRIRYNEKVTDLIDVLTPKVISPKEPLEMRVRIIGSGLATVKTDSGHGNNLDGYDVSNKGNKPGEDESGDVDDERRVISTSVSDLPVEVLCSINHAEWSRVFYGTQSSVIPTDIVLETSLQPGQTVEFASRGFTTEWLPLYSTSTDTKNVIVLKNGDPAPPQIRKRQYGQIQGFIKPYLSTDGKTVKIGNRDLLVLFELDQTNPSAPAYDYQDIGVLVTFD